MLTKKQIFGSARLLQTYGQLPPGYVDHDSTNQKGPYDAESLVPFCDACDDEAGETVEIVEVKDATTGELRMEPRRR